MNSIVLRSALILGALIGLLNVVFAGLEVGFASIPAWFYLLQLLLIPAMLIAIDLFNRAYRLRPFLSRATLYAAGWFFPYLIYKVSGDMLKPTYNLQASVLVVLISVVLFGLLFAAIRRPQE